MSPTDDSISGQVKRVRRLMLKLLRVAGVSQAEIDRRLNHRGLTNRILSGKNDLKYEHILLILGAVGISAEEFFQVLHAKPGDLPSPTGLGGLLHKLAFDAGDEEFPEVELPAAPPPEPGEKETTDRFSRVVAEAVEYALRTLPDRPPREP